MVNTSGWSVYFSGLGKVLDDEVLRVAADATCQVTETTTVVTRAVVPDSLVWADKLLIYVGDVNVYSITLRSRMLPGDTVTVTIERFGGV